MYNNTYCKYSIIVFLTLHKGSCVIILSVNILYNSFAWSCQSASKLFMCSYLYRQQVSTCIFFAAWNTVSVCSSVPTQTLPRSSSLLIQLFTCRSDKQTRCLRIVFPTHTHTLHNSAHAVFPVCLCHHRFRDDRLTECVFTEKTRPFLLGGPRLLYWLLGPCRVNKYNLC